MLEERAKIDFDQNELMDFINGDSLEYIKTIYDEQEKHPELHMTHKFYEMTREE